MKKKGQSLGRIGGNLRMVGPQVESHDNAENADRGDQNRAQEGSVRASRTSLAENIACRYICVDSTPTIIESISRVAVLTP